MYRRRRLVAVLVAVLLVGGVVALVIWRPWEGMVAAPPASASSPPATPERTPTPTETAASTSPAAATSPAATSPAPTPSGSASSIPLCSSGDVTVTAVTDRDSYGGDQDPQLTIRLENEGDTACAMNVGTAAQAFTISSGTDVWWRSTDCQSEPSDQIVQLEPGQSVSSVEPLVWDRTRSSVSTCDGDRPRALAGYYNLVVTVGGIDSEERQFRLR